MLLPALVLLIIGLVLFWVNTRQKHHIKGLSSGIQQLVAVLPVILVAFILAGMLEALIPEEFVHQWLAREAGLKGVLLGTLGGMLLAMGPYASFPIIASIYGAGAGMGTTVSLITGWTLLSLSKTPYEVGFLGPRFALLRMGLSVPFCVAAGAVAHTLENLFF